MVTSQVDSGMIPIITEAAWSGIRAQFARTLPTVVTANYLGTVLNQKDNSAQIILRNLRALGLIDLNGRPTDLAVDWRDDAKYADACRAMLENAYPAELRDIAPPPDPDRDTVRGWFKRARRVGEGAAGNMAATYLMIARAELPSEKKVVTQTKATSPKANSPRSRATSLRKPTQAASNEQREATRVLPPTPQIAVQVNLSPEMTPEQIETIFASMAKHLYQTTE